MSRLTSSPRSMAPAAQRGITLIIVMLILVVVTILGIGGAQIALLGERSTRYDRDYLVASQAAEAALLDAEKDIEGTASSARAGLLAAGVPGGGPGCGSGTDDRGLCAPAAAGTKQIWTNANVFDASTSPAQSVTFGDFTNRHFDSATDAGSSGIKPARAPRYLIEFVPDFLSGNSATSSSTSGAATPILYRITAMGFGPREDVQVVLQSLYRKKPTP